MGARFRSQAADAFDLAFGNLGHAGRPLLPVASVAHLLHHARKDYVL